MIVCVYVYLYFCIKTCSDTKLFDPIINISFWGPGPGGHEGLAGLSRARPGGPEFFTTLSIAQLDFPHWPIRAHMGPYGPVWAHMGRARALEAREKFRENVFIFLSNIFLFSKIVVFDIQTTFFVGETVFFRFLTEIRLRTPIKSPQKPSSRPKTCKFRTTCTLP